MTAQEFDVQLPIDIKGIMEILPHRYPFLLVDRIIELEPGKTMSIFNVAKGRLSLEKIMILQVLCDIHLSLGGSVPKNVIF